VTILTANSAFGETLQFAVTGDHRSNFDGSGVNDQAVTAIANQISHHGNIQFVLDVGDLQAGENTPFPSPEPTPTMATQFQTFTNDMAAGGLEFLEELEAGTRVAADNAVDCGKTIV